MANITDEQKEEAAELNLRKAIRNFCEVNKATRHFRTWCYTLDGELYETEIKITVMEEVKESEDKE